MYSVYQLVKIKQSSCFAIFGALQHTMEAFPDIYSYPIPYINSQELMSSLELGKQILR